MALSHVHRGTLFEQHSLSVLQNSLSMALARVGGRGDGGVDLQGWWWLPERLTSCAIPSASEQSANMDDGRDPGRGGDARMRIRVLAQCKLERRKLSPKSVRELEGVLLRYREYVYVSRGRASSLLLSGMRPLLQHIPAPSSMAPLSSGSSTSISVDEQLDPVVGLLISAVPFTKGTVLRAHSSPIPLMLLHLPPPPQIVYSPVQDSASDSTTSLVDEDPAEEAETESLGDKLTEDAPSMGTFLFNPALGATHGLLRGHVQPRWEYASPAALARLSSIAQNSSSTAVGLCSAALGRPGLWFEGRRVQSCVPEGAHEMLLGYREEEPCLQDEDYISDISCAGEKSKADEPPALKKRRGRPRNKVADTHASPVVAEETVGRELVLDHRDTVEGSGMVKVEVRQRRVKKGNVLAAA